MSQQAFLAYSELAASLSRMHLAVGASELHGSLSGYLCGGGSASAQAILTALELEGDTTNVDDAGRALVADLYTQIRLQLDDPELGFEPLLPGADQPLAVRGDALVEWCRGFLGGLGLSGFGGPQGLSEESAEILRDLDTIAASHFSYDDEDDEDSLTEVFEFVRIGVLLLHAERQVAPSSRLH